MLHHLQRALESPYGIVVRTSDVPTLRQRLYAERRKVGPSPLDDLILSPSRANPTEELWIINPPKEEVYAQEIPSTS